MIERILKFRTGRHIRQREYETGYDDFNNLFHSLSEEQLGKVQGLYKNFNNYLASQVENNNLSVSNHDLRHLNYYANLEMMNYMNALKEGKTYNFTPILAPQSDNITHKSALTFANSILANGYDYTGQDYWGAYGFPMNLLMMYNPKLQDTTKYHVYNPLEGLPHFYNNLSLQERLKYWANTVKNNLKAASDASGNGYVLRGLTDNDLTKYNEYDYDHIADLANSGNTDEAFKLLNESNAGWDLSAFLDYFPEMFGLAESESVSDAESAKAAGYTLLDTSEFNPWTREFLRNHPEYAVGQKGSYNYLLRKTSNNSYEPVIGDVLGQDGISTSMDYNPASSSYGHGYYIDNDGRFYSTSGTNTFQQLAQTQNSNSPWYQQGIAKYYNANKTRGKNTYFSSDPFNMYEHYPQLVKDTDSGDAGNYVNLLKMMNNKNLYDILGYTGESSPHWVYYTGSDNPLTAEGFLNLSLNGWKNWTGEEYTWGNLDVYNRNINYDASKRGQVPYTQIPLKSIPVDKLSNTTLTQINAAASNILTKDLNSIDESDVKKMVQLYNAGFRPVGDEQMTQWYKFWSYVMLLRAKGTLTFEKGGIIKAQEGTALNNDSVFIPYSEEDSIAAVFRNELYAAAKAAGRSEKLQLAWNEDFDKGFFEDLHGYDYARLAAFGTDIIGLIAAAAGPATSGGGSLVAEGSGVVSMLTDLGADIADPKISGWQTTKNALINALFAGTAFLGGQSLKIGKNIWKYAPKIIKGLSLILPATLLNSPEFRESWIKLLTGNISDLNGTDRDNIIMGARALTGYARFGAHELRSRTGTKYGRDKMRQTISDIDEGISFVQDKNGNKYQLVNLDKPAVDAALAAGDEAKVINLLKEAGIPSDDAAKSIIETFPKGFLEHINVGNRNWSWLRLHSGKRIKYLTPEEGGVSERAIRTIASTTNRNENPKLLSLADRTLLRTIGKPQRGQESLDFLNARRNPDVSSISRTHESQTRYDQAVTDYDNAVKNLENAKRLQKSATTIFKKDAARIEVGRAEKLALNAQKNLQIQEQQIQYEGTTKYNTTVNTSGHSSRVIQIPAGVKIKFTAPTDTSGLTELDPKSLHQFFNGTKNSTGGYWDKANGILYIYQSGGLIKYNKIRGELYGKNYK